MKRKIDLLKAMKTFVLVSEKGSFSAVSRELNIVASAISRQVSDLEEHFSCQLLYRTTRAMQLTAEGSYYLGQFKDVLGRMENLENVAHERQQKVAGHLRISAPRGSAGLGFFKAASDFMKQHPQVKISWLFVNRFVNMVEEGVDLAIRVGELADSSFIARRYGHLKVNFVASEHYLTQQGSPEHPKELLKHQCIVDSSNRLPGRWRYREGNKEELVAIHAFVEANDGDIVARLAADGHGIAYLPTFLTQAYLDSGLLVPVLQDYEFDSAPVSLVYPANRLANTALNALVDHLLEHKADK
ncbi:LysR family transcriptional regulator [Thalassomonas actiniarum]|uniref:LysR family transcriptional regulator n=1 Tax=Thalassomonas actiniarum TaxID=485447 RepID=A0AAE9YU26_9GAMM|nr:LysR family transcriptional regulator [Thalassomonas actiniarum]WDE00305.1 LysR family transcriptional regulator [Thalassomonas actiniarum]